MSTTTKVISAATKATTKATSPKTMKIAPRRSSARGHANHGWLNSYHTFSFASYHDPAFTTFGALRVLNEDRVAPQSGFPTHPHRDAEIFSYILSGELTHRDSMVSAQAGSTNGSSPSSPATAGAGKSSRKDDFSRMRRGDVQFTTGGTGIAHSEQNEHPDLEVHFLQIWALPWKRGLPPTYHTATFPSASKRDAFVTILSPLRAGAEASKAEEEAAVPVVEGSIPIHADFLMGAAILGKGVRVGWGVGGVEEGVVRSREGRKVYVHLPMRGVGARVKVGGEVELEEGDGAFVTGVDAGVELGFESVGEGEAEVVVLDSD